MCIRDRLGVFGDVVADAGDPGDALDAMAREYADADGTSFEVGYAKALNTPEGKAIYKQMRQTA